MQWIDEQDQKNIKGYNPLTVARDIENIALEFTKKHLGSNKKNMSIIKKDIGKWLNKKLMVVVGWTQT